MTDSRARAPLEGNFDAKKHSYRQTQDGVVVAFVVDPADIDPEFATAPLGTPLKVAYAEYDPATGQPKEKPAREKRERVQTPSQHCATWCKNPEFQVWIIGYLKTQLPAVADGWTHEQKARFLVLETCGLDPYKNSRSELDIDDRAAEQWKRLHTSFIHRENL